MTVFRDGNYWALWFYVQNYKGNGYMGVKGAYPDVIYLWFC